MITVIIIVGIALTIAISLILLYNGMVNGKNMVDEAWSGISVQLKRRHDLVPVLVNSVKGYMTHEQEPTNRKLSPRSPSCAPRLFPPLLPARCRPSQMRKIS